MAQFVTRLDDDLVVAVDALVREGVAESRSGAVRLALRDLVERHRRLKVGLDIVDGYRRVPQDADDAPWSDEATARMIAEEPW